MTFTSAIKQCYHKAFTLRGRASRSEYWFFCLYLLILCFVLVTIMVLWTVIYKTTIAAWYPTSWV